MSMDLHLLALKLRWFTFHYGICHSGACDSPELFQYVCTVTYGLLTVYIQSLSDSLGGAI